MAPCVHVNHLLNCWNVYSGRDPNIYYPPRLMPGPAEDYEQQAVICTETRDTHTHTDTHEPLVEVPDSQVIYTTFLILIYENKRRVHSLCYTKSMYHKCNIIWQVPISKIIHHLMSECNQVCSFVSYNTGVTHKHIHTYTLVIRDQPWWLGEPRLADCWKAGPMSSACLWLEERSILSCWERERNHEYVGLI